MSDGFLAAHTSGLIFPSASLPMSNLNQNIPVSMVAKYFSLPSMSPITSREFHSTKWVCSSMQTGLVAQTELLRIYM